jgi:hypothetical protein
MRDRRGNFVFLLALLLSFTFLKGIFWAVLVAPLDAPDEPSHFNYVVQVREGYLLPVVDLVSPGGLRTPPSTPLNADVRAFFAGYDYKFFRSMPYESAQPPLYYWGASLWTRPLGIAPHTIPSMLLAARLFSVVLGTAAVFATWLALRWGAPHARFLGWAAPLALTLSPAFTFTSATVSNDAGMLFWGSALLAVWALGLRAVSSGRVMGRWGFMPVVALCALLTALGILTKLTFVATIPASLLWIVWLVRERGASSDTTSRVKGWLVMTGAYLLVVCGIVAPWVARNLRVYGEPTGARAIFDLIHRIYWDRLGYPQEQLFTQFPLPEFLVRSFRSFWALFGWATVWLDDWVYWVLVGCVLVALAGLITLLVQRGRYAPPLMGPPARLLGLCAVVVLLAFANYLGYNSLVEFQPHMRYTFVSLPAAMLLVVTGLAYGPWGQRSGRLLVLGLLVFLGMIQALSAAAVWEQTMRVMEAVAP